VEAQERLHKSATVSDIRYYNIQSVQVLVILDQRLLGLAILYIHSFNTYLYRSGTARISYDVYSFVIKQITTYDCSRNEKRVPGQATPLRTTRQGETLSQVIMDAGKYFLM